MKKAKISAMLLFLISTFSMAKDLPDFELYNLDRELKTYADVKGETLTVIDFWATWCKPCTRAIPKLNELSRAYGEKGVAFLGINVDSPRNDAKVKPFVNALKIDYEVLRDPNSAYLSEANVSGLPTLLIVDADRQVRYVHQGYRTGDEKIIDQEIAKLLKETSSE